MTEKQSSHIVLGGGGFIGTNLCRRLVADGHRVRAFGRSRSFPEAMEGVEWFQGDFGDAAALAAAIETFDVVYHLVHGTTLLSAANHDMAGDLTRNVVASLGMLEICRKLAVSRVIFVSSGGAVYGSPQQVPIRETAPTAPISAYGISKLSIEKYFALYHQLHKADYRILRVSNAFGPFQASTKNQGVIASIISRALRDEDIEIWGDGSVVRDFIFIEDVIDAIVAAEKDCGGARIFNIGSGVGHSLREVLTTVEGLIGRKLRVQYKSSRPVDVPTSVLGIDRAREILRWAPKTTFEDGLNETIAWWRQHGNPKGLTLRDGQGLRSH